MDRPREWRMTDPLKQLFASARRDRPSASRKEAIWKRLSAGLVPGDPGAGHPGAVDTSAGGGGSAIQVFVVGVGTSSKRIELRFPQKNTDALERQSLSS